jgi:hypothetical protein
MMRKQWWAAGAWMALAASVMAADIDYSDFDDTLMRSMDDAVKDLDSTVGGQDAQGSLANAAVLGEGFAWAEKYFAAKPEAPRGAAFAREGREHLAELVKYIEAKDFDAAATGVRAVVRTCKACHEAYKPPE